MTLVVQGDPDEMEALAAENPAAMQAISDRAKEHGLIAHRFYGSAAGKIMALDEWPTAEAFQSFFASVQSDIQPMMERAKVTTEPDVTFWRKLDTRDDVGWDA